MKVSRIASTAEAILDLLGIVATTVIVSDHRWLDMTLWAVAMVGLTGAIWLASRRRRLVRMEMTKPK